jgi:hypothetical protein
VAAAGAGVFVVSVGGCCLDNAYTSSIRHLTRVSHATMAGYQSGHCAMPVHDSILFTTMLNSHDLYSTSQVQTTDSRAILFWKLAYISHRLRGEIGDLLQSRRYTPWLPSKQKVDSSLVLLVVVPGEGTGCVFSGG